MSVIAILSLLFGIVIIAVIIAAIVLFIIKGVHRRRGAEGTLETPPERPDQG